MGEITIRCRWVRDRLPLLDGGDLTTQDRRKAEQHLILCPTCQRHRGALAHAIGALQAAAALPPAGLESAADAPSLWPALARQIRESRHEPRPARLVFDPRSWAEALLAVPPRNVFRSAPLLATAWAAALLVTIGVGLWARVQVRAARDQTAAATAAVPARSVDPAPIPVPPVDVPAPNPGVALSDLGTPPNDLPAPGRRVDYDLEHGIPMARDGRDARPTYSH